jgi:hypothetical protein
LGRCALEEEGSPVLGERARKREEVGQAEGEETGRMLVVLLAVKRLGLGGGGLAMDIRERERGGAADKRGIREVEVDDVGIGREKETGRDEGRSCFCCVGKLEGGGGKLRDSAGCEVLRVGWEEGRRYFRERYRRVLGPGEGGIGWDGGRVREGILDKEGSDRRSSVAEERSGCGRSSLYV